jgi:galactokinase/mevalonate kinase-like predicted kinase
MGRKHKVVVSLARLGGCPQQAAHCSKWALRTAKPHLHDDLPRGTGLSSSTTATASLLGTK